MNPLFDESLITVYKCVKLDDGSSSNQRYEVCGCKKCFKEALVAVGISTESITEERITSTERRMCVKAHLNRTYNLRTNMYINMQRVTAEKLDNGMVVLRVGDPIITNSPFTTLESSVPVLPESLVQSGLYKHRIVRYNADITIEHVVYEFVLLGLNRETMIGYAYKILCGFGLKKNYPVKVGVTFRSETSGDSDDDIFEVTFNGTRDTIQFIRTIAIPEMFELLERETWKRSVSVKFPAYELQMIKSRECSHTMHVFVVQPGTDTELPLTTRRLIFIEMILQDMKAQDDHALNMDWAEIRIRDEGFLEVYAYDDCIDAMHDRLKDQPLIKQSSVYDLPKY